MNDEDLLGYFEIHARTERALFHRDQVARLLKLADAPCRDGMMPEWLAVHIEVAEPLVKKARMRLRIQELETENAKLRVDLIEARDALQWCSGAHDFQVGAWASVGFDKIVRPLLERLRKAAR